MRITFVETLTFTPFNDSPLSPWKYEIVRLDIHFSNSFKVETFFSLAFVMCRVNILQDVIPPNVLLHYPENGSIEASGSRWKRRCGILMHSTKVYKMLTLCIYFMWFFLYRPPGFYVALVCFSSTTGIAYPTTKFTCGSCYTGSREWQ